jgi:hypothetical protein
VEQACQRAAREHIHLREALLEMPEILQLFAREEIVNFFDNHKFSLAGRAFIDNVLAAEKSPAPKPKPGAA